MTRTVARRSDRDALLRIYQRLYSAFGPQHWWPGETPFEVMVGAVLTQNTNWANVERAIARLKRAGLLEPGRLAGCPERLLARLIRPAGYFNVKARRLRAFMDWYRSRVGDRPLTALRGVRTARLREELLSIPGIGPETADSILLYALGRRVFVVDAYTLRVLSRHGLIGPGASYDRVQRLFHEVLPRSTRLYNEYHALLVRLGKSVCRPRPACDRCPLLDELGPPAHLSQGPA